MTTTDLTTPVLAAGPWANNAELIADLPRLGYLRPDWVTLDPTYGLGNFWSRWRPELLWRSDLDPAKSPDNKQGVDATKLNWRDNQAHAVVLDPPYKLNGRPTEAVDARYGVGGEYSSVEGRHRLMADMLTEAARVSSDVVLFKCQDQVNAGRRWWQTRMFADHGEALGLELVDQLQLASYRPQPRRGRCTRCDAAVMLTTGRRWTRVVRAAAGGGPPAGLICPRSSDGHDVDDNVPPPQEHSHSNFSTLLVFRWPTSRVGTATPTAQPTLNLDGPA